MSDAGDSRLALKDSLSRLSGLRRDYGIYLWALLIFATSRMVVFIGVNFGTLLVRDPDPTKWEAGPYWYHRLLRWDSGWYAAIVRDGYQYSDDPTVMASVNFFPLYPLLSAIAKGLLGTREWGALLVVANASSLLAIVLLTKFLRDELDEESALLSLTLFCFFPSSLFLSAGYSESLCLVFVLLALMLLSRQQFVLAAMMAGVSLAARSTCIVLAPVILLEIWRHNRLPLPRLLAKLALCGVLAISGLLVYMVYLQVKFGHPMAFAVSQDAFTHERFADRITGALTFDPTRLQPWSYSVWAICFLALAIASFWRLRLALSLYALAAILLPYLMFGRVSASTDRYLLMCVPGFIMLGVLCKGRLWLTVALTGLWAALLLRKTALFSQWVWEG
jgi:hypothetical protein